MYKLIALDLDGTLTNDAKEVTPYTKKVLQEAAQKGAAIALVSGRPTIGIRRVAQELELNRIGGYILAYNGGHILDCKTGEDIFRALFPGIALRKPSVFPERRILQWLRMMGTEL